MTSEVTNTFLNSLRMNNFRSLSHLHPTPAPPPHQNPLVHVRHFKYPLWTELEEDQEELIVLAVMVRTCWYRGFNTSRYITFIIFKFWLVFLIVFIRCPLFMLPLLDCRCLYYVVLLSVLPSVCPHFVQYLENYFTLTMMWNVFIFTLFCVWSLNYY